MLTAAEALRKSTTGMIQPVDSDGLYRFNNELKVWESKSLIGSDDFATCIETNRWFSLPKFTPFDPEPADTELEEAKKLFPVGSWFKYKNTFSETEIVSKVNEVSRDGEGSAYELIIHTNDFSYYAVPYCTPVWVAHGRCCLTDPPKEKGLYLVIGSSWKEVFCYDPNRGVWSVHPNQGDKWYPLPQRSE